MLSITWYGHAAFLLEGEDARGETKRVVLDPYCAPDVGTYAPIDDVADMVAVSHENAKYHSHVETIRGREDQSRPTFVDGLALLAAPVQPKQIDGVVFTATRVWENEERREPIAMLGVTLGGVRVLHMGDCGHALSADEIQACETVDVLLALAGGPPTLALTDLVAFVAALKPRVVIPMHFGNDKINLNLRPVDAFLALLPANLPVRRLDTPTVSLEKASLPAQTEIWVMPPAR